MDCDSSSLQKWIEDLMQTLHDLTEKQVKTWCEIIVNTGVDSDTREEWTTTFKESIKDLYQDMIDDATFQQRRLGEKIEKLLEKSSQLCKELGIRMPEFGAKQLSLKQEYLTLESQVEEYEKEVQKRKQEIALIDKQQVRLCKLLGREPKIIPESPLLTEQQLTEIRNYIETLENEKFAKSERFVKIKGSVLDIAIQLGYEPKLDFEEIALSKDDFIFVLTDQNIQLLDEFLDRLTCTLNSTTEDIARLTDQMKKLWDMLNEDVKKSAEFLQAHSAISLANLKAIEDEVNRLNQLKKSNIEKFVKMLRTDITSLWDQCHYTQAQRNKFEFFYTDCFTEDLLTLHDIEIIKLNNYHSKHKAIFNLLEKRQEMWSKLDELEERANAPDRFKNRGGQLLKEEKDRNALSKRIPNIESQLLKLSQEYEQKEGVLFLSWGDTIESIIEKDNNIRNEERLLKLSARKREKPSTPGKSLLALSRAPTYENLASTIGTPVLKRKLIAPTETFTALKRSKVLSANKGTKTAPPKILVNSKAAEKLRRFSKDKIKRKYLRLSHDKHKNHAHVSDSGISNEEYNTFKTEIANKENCRSTLYRSSSNEDSINDVVPLPVTPVRSKSPKFSVAPKFSAAPSLKLQF